MRNEYLYDLYRIAFLSVKQKCTNGVTNAAKPALVMAVIEGIAVGEIKNNQIKFVSDKYRYVASQHIVEAVEAIAQTIYPELF